MDITIAKIQQSFNLDEVGGHEG